MSDMIEYDHNKNHYKMGIDYLIELGYEPDDIYIPNANVTRVDIERRHKNFIDMFWGDSVIRVELNKKGEVLYPDINTTYYDIDYKYNFYHFRGEPDLRTLSDGKYWEIKKFYKKRMKLFLVRNKLYF